jgi:hypothetical protein
VPAREHPQTYRYAFCEQASTKALLTLAFCQLYPLLPIRQTPVENCLSGPSPPPLICYKEAGRVACWTIGAEVAAFPCNRYRRDRRRQAERARLARAGPPARPAQGYPTIIRHLHNLAALEPALESAAKFQELVLAAVAADVGRGGEKDPPTDPAVIFSIMLQRLAIDPLWAREYDDFMQAVSFAKPGETIVYGEALETCRRLTDRALNPAKLLEQRE